MRFASHALLLAVTVLGVSDHQPFPRSSPCLSPPSCTARSGAPIMVAAAQGCTGYPVKERMRFWLPGQVQNSSKWNDTSIPHTAIPFTTSTGYKVSAGHIGKNEFARTDVLRRIDAAAVPWQEGLVDDVYGLPKSRTGGYVLRTTSLHENFNAGLNSSRFVVLKQKASLAQNVAIVEDKVNGVLKNVARLRMLASGSGAGWFPGSGAVLQTRDVFAAGRYEITAKVPAEKGMIFALWTFHYETHYDAAHLPAGEADSQFVPDVTGYISRLNHEIDWEIPASCSGLCDNGGCPGQFDTANFNSYLYANNNGIGPGFLNMCVRAPAGKSFVPDDGKYHTYAFEWHTGDADIDGPGADRRSGFSAGSDVCTPHVDFFFDGEYVATVDAFVPSRGSRFVFGVWPANKNWAGQGGWQQLDTFISEVHVCPFNEAHDAMYPMRFDQPTTPADEQLWEVLDIPPAKPSLPGPDETCPGSGSNCDRPSDRKNGCSCGTDDDVCASTCCDAVSGTCADVSVCKDQCNRGSARPDGCPCSSSESCDSRCCSIAGVCSPATACVHPCDVSVGRPLGCNCSLAGQCNSTCCDYNAVPGLGNGTCAAESTCQAECAMPDKKPVGCTCSDSSTCQTSCCSDGFCKLGDSCPSPSGCQQPEGRPVGCVCNHSWQCKSQWCENLVCTDH